MAKLTDNTIPNELLIHERKKRLWTLADVASQIVGLGLDGQKAVSRWELGKVIPEYKNLRQLENIYGRNAKELGYPDEGTIPFFSVPNLRNPFFTGREDTLEKLHAVATLRDEYRKEHPHKRPLEQLPRALTGLGGIGKTQIAIEYAYRHVYEYHTIVWLHANSPEILRSEFAAIATLVNLSAKQLQDQDEIIAAVKYWLTRMTRWLLIFDNVESAESIYEFVPSPCHGHIILTTRSHATGKYAQRIEVEEMQLEEGANFLLKRVKVTVPSEKDYSLAKDISQMLEGLPLALDQAGAYIEETGDSLSNYCTLFHVSHELLLQRRGISEEEYPQSVATTWSLAFEKVKNTNPVAIELLRLLAFLAPDAIPEEIIYESASDLGPVLQTVTISPVALNLVIGELLRYSLVRRNANTKTIGVHRLVQMVVRNELDEDSQREWAVRAVQAVNKVFLDPDTIDWTLCQRYLPNALVCVNLIETWDLKCLEGTQLLNNVGAYLRRINNPSRAEPLYKRAIAIREEVLGSEHPNTAINLSYLAACYNDQTEFEKAKYWAEQAWTIQERVLGTEHLDVAVTHIILGYSYHNMGQYEEAEQSFQRALAINEVHLGSDHLEVALCLNNLGALYNDEALYMNEREKYQQAQVCYQRALEIREHRLGPDHPLTASTLNNLGTLFNDLGQYEEAEQYLLQSLAIDEKAFGPNHPEISTDLTNLAKAHKGQKKYDLAESYAQRALSIYEGVGRAEHLSSGYPLTQLGEIYHLQQRYAKAEVALKRALHIRKRTLGIEHPLTVKISREIAELDRDRMQHKNKRPKEDI